jgi:hypothetical protein
MNNTLNSLSPLCSIYPGLSYLEISYEEFCVLSLIIHYSENNSEITQLKDEDFSNSFDLKPSKVREVLYSLVQKKYISFIRERKPDRVQTIMVNFENFPKEAFESDCFAPGFFGDKDEVF